MSNRSSPHRTGSSVSASPRGDAPESLPPSPSPKPLSDRRAQLHTRHTNDERAAVEQPSSPAPSTRSRLAEHGGLTLDQLVREAKAGRVVFRVHTPHSACPLQWTGDVETSGFSSLNHHLGSLTPSAYRAALSPSPSPGPSSPSTSLPPAPSSSLPTPPWPDWTSGWVVRQSMLDHVNRRVQASWDVAWDGQETGADGYSPWISATRDAEWAVWDVARRLVNTPSVSLAMISLSSPPAHAQQRSGVAGEIVLDPIPIIRQHKWAGMTNNEKEGVDRAHFTSSTSREVLFYGRVLAESVVANIEFTPDDLPLELPPHWFHARAKDSEPWITQLVWDPEDIMYDWQSTQRVLAAAKHGATTGGRWPAYDTDANPDHEVGAYSEA